MRLLNIQTRQLETFYGKEIPRYAILSHTWGRDEVLFADIGTAEAGLKTGYKKIDYSCKEASETELKYLWVDTCCIDKSNNTELSEAINSMFRWYQNAEVCYAYLEDVTLEKYKAVGLNSRWFSRGWTLQELLAPAEVKFFADAGNTWEFLGSRHDLAEQISDLTHIDAKCLSGQTELKQKSISTRMSWAASRQTTREEDLAYCLLGIFDINMPLIYGEGPRAFQRLQEEIIKFSNDQSIFAWGFRPDFWFPAAQIKVADFKISGPLAPSPLEFQSSSSIVPTRYSQADKPFLLTNQGLQMTLPILQNYKGKSIGFINCGILQVDGHCIGMLLERTETGRLIRKGVRFLDDPRLYSTFLIPIESAIKAIRETTHIGGRPVESPRPELAQSVTHRLIDISSDTKFFTVKVLKAFPNDVELVRENMILKLPQLRNTSTAILTISVKAEGFMWVKKELAVFIELPDEDRNGAMATPKVKLFGYNEASKAYKGTWHDMIGSILDPHDEKISAWYSGWDEPRSLFDEYSLDVTSDNLPDSLRMSIGALLERIEISNHRSYRIKFSDKMRQEAIGDGSH